jgi:hypothetical protein
MVDSHFLDRIDIHVDDDECMTLKIARNKTTDFQFYRCQLGFVFLLTIFKYVITNHLESPNQ